MVSSLDFHRIVRFVNVDPSTPVTFGVSVRVAFTGREEVVAGVTLTDPTQLEPK
jgi:hypothetical protein